jgi:hypothetical protein
MVIAIILAAQLVVLVAILWHVRASTTTLGLLALSAACSSGSPAKPSQKKISQLADCHRKK